MMVDDNSKKAKRVLLRRRVYRQDGGRGGLAGAFTPKFRFNLELDEALHSRIAMALDRHGMTRTDYIRAALELALQNDKL